MHLQIKMNELLFLSDPQETELGKSILKHSVILIHRIGYENFTFKKLAAEAGTTEASVYRYFDNKQGLLMYLVAWYWQWLYYQIGFTINNITNPEQKLKKIIRLLAATVKDDRSTNFINESILHQIVVEQGMKTYLSRQITKEKQQQFFKPYKDLCKRIGDVMLEVNPNYPFPRALSITLIEIANLQKSFKQKMPTVTDISRSSKEASLVKFLEDLVLGSLEQNQRL